MTRRNTASETRVEHTLARVRADVRDGHTAADLLELGMALHWQIVEKGRQLRELDRANALDPRPHRSRDEAVRRARGRELGMEAAELVRAYADVHDAQALLAGEIDAEPGPGYPAPREEHIHTGPPA